MVESCWSRFHTGIYNILSAPHEHRTGEKWNVDCWFWDTSS